MFISATNSTFKKLESFEYKEFGDDKSRVKKQHLENFDQILRSSAAFTNPVRSSYSASRPKSIHIGLSLYMHGRKLTYTEHWARAPKIWPAEF